MLNAAAVFRSKGLQNTEQLPTVSILLADEALDPAETTQLTPLTRAIGAVDTLQPSDSRVAGLRSARPSAAAHLTATISQFMAEPSTGRSDSPADSISTPVRDPAWGEKLGGRIVMLASSQLQTAEIRLTPAELGPLRVRVSIDDGLANVTIHAQHSVTREAIEQALPRLREMMAESGLSLGQTDVSDQGVAGGDPDQGSTAASAITEEASENPSDGEPAERQNIVTSNGLVDTFA